MRIQIAQHQLRTTVRIRNEHKNAVSIRRKTFAISLPYVNNVVIQVVIQVVTKDVIQWKNYVNFPLGDLHLGVVVAHQ
jgi:hypothetical protein